eukprot:TRINITY_DN8910_c0_g1_i1.p1 TRINITY_DN8910_c0_g1~~TRINITY_DN8910_c0_g1_i1.p1  ORF type:complete len:743 (+),score=222.02 TRINITY_DN8910_c0_g1_i1:102-2330(+)
MSSALLRRSRLMSRPWCGLVCVRAGENASAKVRAAAQSVQGRLYVLAEGLWPSGELPTLQQNLASLYHAAHSAAPSVDTRVRLCDLSPRSCPPEVDTVLGWGTDEEIASGAGLSMTALQRSDDGGHGWAPKGAGDPITQYSAVCMGGTFDRLHLGHKLLLAAAAATVKPGGRLFCGCTGEKLLRDKRLGELLEGVGYRSAVVAEFLRSVRPDVKYEVGELEDGYGPSIHDPAFEAIVVSEETVSGGMKCNEKRAEKSMSEMAVVTVGLVSASDGALTDGLAHDAKLSSSGLRTALVGTVLDGGRDWCRRTAPGRPYTIGLCGTICAGKSTVSRILGEQGAYLIDCDKVGHSVYEKGSPGYEAVVKRFGDGVVGEDGEIDRKKGLGPLVFGAEPEKKKNMDDLCKIVWPLIRKRVSELLAATDKPVAVVEGAILVEAGWDTLVDEVWLVSVPPAVSVKRLCERNGFDEQAATQRVASQPSGRERIKAGKCHVLIPNFADESALRELVVRVADCATRERAKQTLSTLSETSEIAAKWVELVSKYGATPAQASDWWRRVRDRYYEVHRKYHTMEHVAELLQHCKDAAGDVAEPDLVDFAVFFHDVIYNPEAKHPANEMESAAQWREFAETCLPALDAEKRKAVADWIERTAWHMKGDATGDLAVFLDADLAALGRPEPAYCRYAEQIRMEYAHVPDADFRKGRPHVMRQFLAKPEGPYFTERAVKTFGARALSNVSKEIERLSAA